MVNRKYPLSLFSGMGIEIEYMIVDKNTLEVLPIADKLMQAVAGESVCEVRHDDIVWSNELVMHLIELKTAEPVFDFFTVETSFQREIDLANNTLSAFGAQLMPTGMHPLMNPASEMRIWPHESSAIYKKYNEIFDCRGHGWSNLQSTHINLPFADEDEFVRLHAAIRCLLPLIPALAASSPFVEGVHHRKKDMRLHFYSVNSAKIPSVAGQIIPEPVGSYSDYQQHILEPMYQEISRFDPEGILKYEWLNSRGAIARFDRGSIEIRLIDSQESVVADLAIIWLINACLKYLVSEKWSSFEAQFNVDQSVLVRLFNEAIGKGEKVVINENAFLSIFDLTTADLHTARDFWRLLLARIDVLEKEDSYKTMAEDITRSGTLASRILAARDIYGKNSIKSIYQKLSNCLSENRLFRI
jgi:carboxylate-amine ligase